MAAPLGLSEQFRPGGSAAGPPEKAAIHRGCTIASRAAGRACAAGRKAMVKTINQEGKAIGAMRVFMTRPNARSAVFTSFPMTRSCSTRRKISEFILRTSSTARSCHILSSRRKPSRMGLSARTQRDRAAGHRHSQTACGMRSCRVTRYLALTTQGWRRCGCCRWARSA